MAYSTCTSCDREFSGLSTFDAHQDWDGAELECLHPTEVDLTKQDDVWGNWNTDLDIGSGYTPKTGDKELTCRDCNRKWTVERSRGRYPTRCPACA